MPTTHSYTIIDADTHITEARDTFTSRVASKWKDRVPRVEWDAEAGEEAWFLEGKKIGSPGAMSVAGWREDYPSHPPRYEDAHPGAYLADARLKYMDELGIWHKYAGMQSIDIPPDRFSLLTGEEEET